jgi:hypothetical protein
MRLLNKRRNAKLTPAERSEIAAEAGKAGSEQLTKTQRKERARRAAAARWLKPKQP